MAPKGVGPPAIRRGTPGCRSLVRTSDKHVSVPCRTSLKEVIQPHLPIRLPCYDFTQVIGHTVASALQKVKLPANGAKIGTASCRARVCQYVKIALVDVSLKKNVQENEN